MAGWNPSSTSIGGVAVGCSILSGELYDWWEMGNPGQGGSRNPLNMTCNYNIPPSSIGPFPMYGSIIPIGNFIYSDISNTDHEGLIFELNVKKPEQATYYKQTFCFYLTARNRQEVYRGSTWQHPQCYKPRFARREYSDATTYIESTLHTFGQSMYSQQATFLVDGPNNLPNNWLWTGDGGMLFSVGFTTAGGVKQWGVGIWKRALRGNGLEGTGYGAFALPVSTLESAFGGSFSPGTNNDPNEDPDDNNDNPWDGGDGDHDDHSDYITDPDEPGAGGSSIGFLTLYTGSAAVMRTFAASLWDTSVITEVMKYFTDPMQWIISCLMLPCIPETSGAAAPVWGNFTWPVTMSLVSNQYKTVDCGKIGITRYWGNFMDYAPYTKITIWLPYIGYRDLDVDMVMEHILHLKYIVDVLTGDCTAILSIDAVGISGPDIPKIVGQYYGNCGVKVPLSMVSHDALVGASINAIVGGAATLAKNGISIGSAAASGDEADVMDSIGAAANSTVSWAANTAVNVINGMKPETTVIGAAGMSAGMMSKQTPFIIKTIPIQSLPDDFRLLHGYMTNRSGKLSDFSGYCEVEQIQLNNIPAYEEELKEILALLKGGVII